MSLQNKNVLCEKFYERFSKLYKAFYSFGLIPKEICETMCKLLDIKAPTYYRYLKRCRETNKINTTFKGEQDRMVKRMNNKEPIKADDDIRELITKALSDEVINYGDEQISMFADGPKGPTNNSIPECPTIEITPDQILEVTKTSAKTYDITGSICQGPPITLRPLSYFNLYKNYYTTINSENSCTFANINFTDKTKPPVFPYFKGYKMSEKYFKKELIKFNNQIKHYVVNDNCYTYCILRLIKGDSSKNMTGKMIGNDLYLYTIRFDDFTKITEKIETAIAELESYISPSYLKPCCVPLVVIDGLHNTSQLKQLAEFSKEKCINIMPVMKLNRTMEYVLSQILINKNMKISDITQYKDSFKKICTAIEYGNKVFVGVGDGKIDVSSEIEVYSRHDPE